MTVRPGTEWGEIVPFPDDAIEIPGDADLAAAIERQDRHALVVRAGDLFRTAGSPARSETAVRAPIDVLHVTADGVEHTAVAHVVARWPGRLGWWRGPIVAAMNVEHIGRLDVAPRAHPNDGRFDLVTVSGGMPLRARWQAYRRLPTGTHVPHPDIATRRAREESTTFDRPLGLWVDGVAKGTVRSLDVRIVPDAAVIYL